MKQWLPRYLPSVFLQLNGHIIKAPGAVVKRKEFLEGAPANFA